MKPVDALAARLGLSDPAEAVLGKLQALYREVDDALAAGSGDRNLPCRKGCAACCRESVFVSAPEFLAVVVAMRRLEDRDLILDRMLEVAARFADELELLEEIGPGPERDEVAARVKFECPLLDPEDACRVYAWRELNGRTFGQSWDGKRGHAYGCELTHEAVGRDRLRLADAWRPRRLLSQAFPEARSVHVYPWWFDRHQAQVRAVWTT